MNLVCLSGTIERFREPTTTPSGVVHDFDVLIDSRKAAPTRIPCCVWDGVAEALADLSDGARVVVIGRLDHRPGGLILTVTQIEAVQ